MAVAQEPGNTDDDESNQDTASGMRSGDDDGLDESHRSLISEELV
jgi:hypothetical protein